MNRFKRMAVTAGAVAAVLASLAVLAQAQDAPQGDAANGKVVFLKLGCFTCHGRSGQGGAYNGPAPILAHTMLPFDGFKGQLRNPANDMPAFNEAVVSDKEIADIYTFVTALPGARSSKDIAILNNN